MIPRGKIVRMVSSKRRVKSKPPKQELATTGPNRSSIAAAVQPVEDITKERDVRGIYPNVFYGGRNPTLI